MNALPQSQEWTEAEAEPVDRVTVERIDNADLERAVTRPILERIKRDLLPLFNGRLALVHIVEDLIAGKRTLWLVKVDGEIQGVALVSVDQWPTGLRTISIDGVAGEDAAIWWRALFDAVAEYGAAKLLCTRIANESRLGWVRLMGDAVKASSVLLEAEI